jgi:uncharacterized protein with FMN-binding domain
MKRVVLAALSTIAGLTMLLQFKTRPTAASASSPTSGGATNGTAGGAAGTTTGSNSTPSTSSSVGTGPTSGTAGTSPSTTASTSAAPSGTVTVTGTAAQTRYGPVQVQLTIVNGALTTVDAVQYPQDRPRDVQINSYAIPALDQEALAAKNSNIDMISGATYTSSGYISSLQSALNKAGLT